MRAALFRRHGGPEVMEIADVPAPAPAAGEALIDVRAAALNHIDVWLRRGLPALKVPLPHVSGGDVCGVVAALGPGVQGVKEGDRVVVNPGLSCGRCLRCLSGQDNLCPDYKMVGEQTWGGEAEQLVVPATNVVAAPAGPSDVTFAAVPITYMTAWQMLVDRARVQVGENVLVLGASAGVGVAAIQIAKLHGARVIAVASTAAKLARARDEGAHEGVMYGETEDLPGQVRRLTGGRGADVVIEHVGGPAFMQAVRACAKGGRIVTCGATAGHEPVLNLRHVFWRQLSIFGSTLAPKGRLLTILDLVAAGKLRPVIDRVLPLDHVIEGHRAIEAREIFGKVVCDVTLRG
jgi:NADPH:quinone reductase-like Zn-dependent oxidoreductase